MIAIYARQSVDKKDSLSIQGQIDLCSKNITEEPSIYQDRGFSGKNTKRPDFERLMQDIEKGLITKLFVYRLDRFSRSISDFSRLWEFLQQHHVEFVSVTENFDTSTPMGRAMLQIVMVFAQLERETTAERVKDNYYQRAALGSWPGGPAPYGFVVGRMPSNHGSVVPTLIPSEQIRLVEEIFQGYSQPDASLGSVARKLNAAGIPAPKRDVWDTVTLSRMLHSPLYVMADEDVYLYYQAKGLIFANALEDFDGIHAGMIIGKRDRSANKYNDLAAQHFSLANHCGTISSELWLNCQYKLDHNKQLSRAGLGKHSWLTGLMKCAACGYSVKVNQMDGKRYLVCSGRSNLSVCDQTISIKLDELEASVTAELCTLLAECADHPDELAVTPNEFSAALAKVDRRIELLVQALAEGNDVTIRYVNRELERLDAERTSLLDKQAQSKQHSLPKKLQKIDFMSLSLEEKKLVAQHFIQCIKLQNDSADVIWAV